MPTYPEYQQQFARDTINAINNASMHAEEGEVMVSTGTIQQQLDVLINALPYYGDSAIDNLHRGALANLLETNLPNNSIVAHPSEFGFGYSASYSYSGSYSGYRDAFYNGVAQTAAAARVASIVSRVNGNLNSNWWGNYGVTILTDAVRQTVSVSLDTSKLTNDLANYNNNFLPALTASYEGVFQAAYGPTADALNTILSGGEGNVAYATLEDAIATGQFTANINQAISVPGDSANAATWFLFNLWVTLQSLGCPDVDGAIRRFIQTGLIVPGQIGPVNWQNGTYRNWYIPLSGADVLSVAAGTIRANMPEKETVFYSQSPFAVTMNVSESIGYSQSLCTWGSLNWYKPSDGSCFGGDTGILMADGTVKPIRNISIGDMVQSDGGPRRAVLIETPRRNKRPLYQLNGLQVFATAAHPFRTARAKGPARVAIDSWALIDGIPTMTAAGVAAMKAGTILAGRSLQGTKEIVVDKITEHIAGDEHDDDLVYDLVLEHWERDNAAYFVGGPETFLAVDAETSDPTFDVPTAAAIVQAMEVVLPACRERHIDLPAKLPHALAGLSLEDLPEAARRGAPALLADKPKRLRIPGPDFYMQNGEWDVHASTLEYHLVRQFGRMLRRETAMGWYTVPGHPSAGDHFTISVNDIELIGEAPLPAHTPVEIHLQLRGWSVSGDHEQRITLPEHEQPVWHLVTDQVVDFGRLPSAGEPATLSGTLHTSNGIWGQFRTVVPVQLTRKLSATPFIYNPAGRIIGRIHLDLRRVTPGDLTRESHLSEQWKLHHAMSMASILGQQLGYRLLARLIQ